MDNDRVQLSITCSRTAHDVSAAAKYRSIANVPSVTVMNAGTPKAS